MGVIRDDGSRCDNQIQLTHAFLPIAVVPAYDFAVSSIGGSSKVGNNGCTGFTSTASRNRLVATEIIRKKWIAYLWSVPLGASTFGVVSLEETPSGCLVSFSSMAQVRMSRPRLFCSRLKLVLAFCKPSDAISVLSQKR